MPRRRLVTLAVVAVTVAVVSGGTTVALSRPDGRSTAEAESAGVPTVASTLQERSYWSPFTTPAATEVERYGGLREMAEKADLIVLGRVVNAAPTRFVGYEPEGDEGFWYWGLQIEVTKVLAGKIAPEVRGPLIVEPALGRPIGDVRSGPVLLFLRHKGAALERMLRARPQFEGKGPLGEELYYRWVSSHGVIIPDGEGKGHAVLRELLGQEPEQKAYETLASEVANHSWADLPALITSYR